MRLNKRRREDRDSGGGEGGAPAWMTTFGDLMSLLLTFFVLLVSFSSIQMVEFQKALGSLKGALGVLKFKESAVRSTRMNIPQLSGFRQRETSEALRQVQEYIRNAGLEDQIQVTVTDEGVNIRMAEPILFDLGKAELKPSSYRLLSKIADLISKWPNMVRVEGHTDDLPIRTPQFPSNWELSAIRAINVIHYFQDQCGIPPTKLAYHGYGEYKPLVPNTSAENRAKNRRVEIVLEASREEIKKNHADLSQS